MPPRRAEVRDLCSVNSSKKSLVTLFTHFGGWVHKIQGEHIPTRIKKIYTHIVPVVRFFTFSETEMSEKKQQRA